MAEVQVGKIEFSADTGSSFKTVPASDPVNHPSHYTDGKIEVLDFILDKQLDFLLGNVVKYVCRAGKKSADTEIEDLRKAAFYLNRKIVELKEKAKCD